MRTHKSTWITRSVKSSRGWTFSQAYARYRREWDRRLEENHAVLEQLYRQAAAIVMHREPDDLTTRVIFTAVSLGF